MQNRFPLDKACRRSLHQRPFGGAEVYFFPWAPIAVGVINVSAARQKIKVALAPHFEPSPLREQMSIEDVALVISLPVERWAQGKNLAQVAGGGKQPAISPIPHSGPLLCAGFPQH